MGYLYVVSSGDNRKIGITDNINKRISDLQVANYEKLTLSFLCECSNPYVIEQILHRALSIYKIRGEWFSLSEDKIISYISAMLLLFPEVTLIDPRKNTTLVPHNVQDEFNSKDIKEVIKEILRCKNAKITKEKTIYRIFKIRKGGKSERWNIASRFYDNVIRRANENT